MKNSRLTVVSICLFMLLGISLQAVQAKVNNVANYFEPLQNQWALLTVDFANAYKPSTARDKMIQEGVTADIAVDVSHAMRTSTNGWFGKGSASKRGNASLSRATAVAAPDPIYTLSFASRARQWIPCALPVGTRGKLC